MVLLFTFILCLLRRSRFYGLSLICIWQIYMDEITEHRFTSYQEQTYLPEIFSERATVLGHTKMTQIKIAQRLGVLLELQQMFHASTTQRILTAMLREGRSASTTDGLSAENVKTVTNDGSFQQTQHSCGLQEFVYIAEAMPVGRLLQQLTSDRE